MRLLSILIRHKESLSYNVEVNMSLKQEILDYALEHWSKNFTGVSAVSVAEKLNCSHKEVLSIFSELKREKKCSLKEGVKLYSISFPFERDSSSVNDAPKEIVTSIFFPSKELLTDNFFNSKLCKQNLPEYVTRLHKGYSQIHLIYFSSEVLKKYLEHPEMYNIKDSTSGGVITLKAEYENKLIDSELDKIWFDKVRFGKRLLANDTVVVATILHDLSELPDSEQSHWHSYELEEPDFSDDDPGFIRFFRRNFEGEWVDYNDPLEKALGKIQEINNLFEDAKLFTQGQNQYLAYPVGNTYKNLCDSCSELYKVVGPDNLNINILKELLRDHFGYTEEDFIHKDSGRPFSKLQLLQKITERISEGYLFIDTINEIKEYRVCADHKIIDPQHSNINYVGEFQRICASLHRSLMVLRNGIEKMQRQIKSQHSLEVKMTREEKLQNLQNWVNSLARVTGDIIPQIRETLAGTKELPAGCPSKESMAALEFDQIKKKLTEVNAAVEMVEDSIFNN